MLRVIGSVVMAALVVIILGCGGGSGENPAAVPVSGTVTLGGQPVEGAQVVFSPTGGEGNAAAGTTDATGKYSLTTGAAGDGAVPGSYRVAITKVEGATQPGTTGMSEEESRAAHYNQAAGGDAEGPKDLLPAKYKSADTSGLKAEVQAGQENRFDFALSEDGMPAGASGGDQGDK